MNRSEFLKASELLEKLYAALPTIECQKKCALSCGPIAFTVVEEHRIRLERKAEFPEYETGVTCPLLKDELCTIYKLRPLVCRLWGLAEGMECPWGCKPSRLITRDEAYALLEAAALVGGGTSVPQMERTIVAMERELPPDT